MGNILDVTALALSDRGIRRAARDARRSYGEFFGSLFKAAGSLVDCIRGENVGYTSGNGNTVHRHSGLFGSTTTVTGECWSCGGSGRVRGRPCRRCGGTGEFRREYND